MFTCDLHCWQLRAAGFFCIAAAEEEGVEPLRLPVVEFFRQVVVVHPVGKTGVGVAQPGAYLFYVHALTQKRSGKSMAQGVEMGVPGKAGLIQHRLEVAVEQVAGVYRPAQGVGKDELFVLISRSGLQLFFGLSGALGLQCPDYVGDEGDGPL